MIFSHFLITFQQAGTCISPVVLRSRRANAHLLVNPILKLTIVLIWKTPACLKFGKTSNRAVENLPQRKLWVWAENDTNDRCTFSQEFDHTEFRQVCAFSETIDLRTLEFGQASTRCPSTASKRATNLHIVVPAITRGTLARSHELKIYLPDQLSIFRSRFWGQTRRSLKTEVFLTCGGNLQRISAGRRHSGIALACATTGNREPRK